MQKHKWYNEIVAWASGAEIEYYIDTIDKWMGCNEPLWAENAEYRIKPPQHCCCEKQTCYALKEPQYLYAYYLAGKLEWSVNRWSDDFKYEYLGKIKLEVEDESTNSN